MLALGAALPATSAPAVDEHPGAPRPRAQPLATPLPAPLAAARRRRSWLLDLGFRVESRGGSGGQGSRSFVFLRETYRCCLGDRGSGGQGHFCLIQHNMTSGT
jgi:hypothetical protein